MKLSTTTCPVCGLPRGRGHPACSKILQARSMVSKRPARKVDPSYANFNPSR